MTPESYSEAVLIVLADAQANGASQGSVTTEDITTAIRERWPGAFPLGVFTDFFVGYEITDGMDLAEQVDVLARFIMEQIPGEPSQSAGAIETAIRLLAEGRPR